MLRECVILVGGLGTRLGPLTRETPKPILPVAGVPFLEHLLRQVARHGFDKIFLCAGFEARQIRDKYDGTHDLAGRCVQVQVIIEPTPAGTAGALLGLSGLRSETFLLMNGDTWFDIDLRAFATKLGSDALVKIALRPSESGSRYGIVSMCGDRVQRFASPDALARDVLINSGIYLFDSKVLGMVPGLPSSLENDLLPSLVQADAVVGEVSEGAFIDIGIPEDYVKAGSIVCRPRPAVFFDRDGVLNIDTGYTYKPEDLSWQKGAVQAIKAANTAGYYVFVVTNQSGVARGYFTEADVRAFHAEMDRQLAAFGAHVDEYRFCPYHPEATVSCYKQASAFRKPAPGMLTSLARTWDVAMEASFMVGDMESDRQAAAAAGIGYVHYAGGDLLNSISPLLR